MSNARILPALEAGKWVICDRFVNSTRVYQGILGQVDHRLIRGLERVAVGDLMPDLTLMLDIPVEIGMARASKRRGAAAPDRFEGENVEFHKRLRQAYLAIAAEEPQRCVVVDASANRETVARQIWNIVGAKLDPVTAPLGSNVRPHEVGA